MSLWFPFYFCSMYSITKATEADAAELMQLVNSAYRGDAARGGWTHEADLIAGDLRTDEGELKNLISRKDSVILKYTEEGRLLGCVYLQQKGDSLYLGMLSVSPQVQAKGIGRKLMEAADAHARALGCRRIEMTVISVRKELIAWYERNGYRPSGATQPFEVDAKFGVPRERIEFLVLEKNL